MIRTLIILFISAIILSGCSSSKALNGTITGTEADYAQEYRNGNYTLAFPVYKRIVLYYENKGRTPADSIYAKAGISALMVDSIAYAQKYLEKIAYKDEATSEVLANTSKMYRAIDNLSKEIKFLNLYFEKNPSGIEANKLKTRLFLTCSESEDVDKGLQIWNNFSEAEKDINGNIEGFILISEIAAQNIHNAGNRVRYTMNNFIIATGGGITSHNSANPGSLL